MRVYVCVCVCMSSRWFTFICVSACCVLCAACDWLDADGIVSKTLNIVKGPSENVMPLLPFTFTCDAPILGFWITISSAPVGRRQAFTVELEYENQFILLIFSVFRRKAYFVHFTAYSWSRRLHNVNGDDTHSVDVTHSYPIWLDVGATLIVLCCALSVCHESKSNM